MGRKFASLKKVYEFAKDLYPKIAQIFKTLLICPASSAIVEHGFSLMNMQMNKLLSSMKIQTLDALMWIYCEYDITDQDADDIVKVWFKNGNQWLAMTSMKICTWTFS